ncbi:MAG: hypothetical protein GY757_22980 [bacterium]|nr:hypothetical protein [bacterium]
MEEKKIILQKITTGLIILVLSIMAFKFIIWNWWKMERFARMTNAVLTAQPAVNLGIFEEKKELFRRSFAHNGKGNYYIISNFDILPHINSGSIALKINRQTVTGFILSRFTNFNIIHSNGHYFVFTAKGCGIEAFEKMRHSLPGIIASIPKLAVNQMKTHRMLIHSMFHQNEKELRYGKGRHIEAIPTILEKGRLYEIHLEYSITGPAVPQIMLAGPVKPGVAGPVKPGVAVPFKPGAHHVLDAKEKGTVREVAIMFRPVTAMQAPRLHLILRGEKRKRPKGTVTFKNIRLYGYEKEPPGLGLKISQVVYIDILDKIKHDFIGVSSNVQ